MSAPHLSVGGYRAESVLGSGGFGTVYLARAGGRRVAVKVLDRAAGAHAVANVRIEAAAMRRVRDRHCVRVLDVIDDDGVCALVTEFIEGASLRIVLDRHGRLTGPQALDVLRGALLGLQSVHRAGMVHGDVKPANILLDRRGRARVIDFGLARDVDSLGTGPSQLIGSPSYMAPEQIRGLPPDVRSDVYAIAAVLYEVLTGQRPMRADTVPALLQMHLATAPSDPRTIDPQISPALAQLCLAGLAKEPAERPQTVREFLDELERAAKERYGRAWRWGLGLGAVVGTTSAALSHEQLTASRIRPINRRWIAAGAGIVAVATVGVVLATHHQAREQPAALAPRPAGSTPTPSGGHLVYAVANKWHSLTPGTGAGSTLAISGPVCCTFAVPSRDGARLLYAGEGVLYVGDAEGRNSTPVWTSPTMLLGAAAWSPSGDRIAFATLDPSGPGPPKSQIDTVNADGTNLVSVASGTNIHSITWSPDGSQLAFTQNQGDIWVAPSAGGPVRVLFGRVQGEGADELPDAISWGSTGTLLFGEAGAQPVGIWAINANGTGLRSVLPGAQAPSFAPDGVHFAALLNGRIVIGSTNRPPPQTLAPTGVTAVRWGG